MFGRNSCDVINIENNSDLRKGVDNESNNENMRRSRSLRKKRGINGRISSMTMGPKGSTEVAVGFELPNQRTIVEINERNNEDGDQINFEDGAAIGTTVRVSDISTESYLRTVGSRPTLSREAKSINSSENDGYESSYQTYSERSFSYPGQHKKLKHHCLLDIQAQISDFAYCPPRQDAYRQSHLPPGYNEHTRSKIKGELRLNDFKCTGSKINGMHMAKKRKSSVDAEEQAKYNYEHEIHSKANEGIKLIHSKVR